MLSFAETSGAKVKEDGSNDSGKGDMSAQPCTIYRRLQGHLLNSPDGQTGSPLDGGDIRPPH